MAIVMFKTLHHGCILLAGRAARQILPCTLRHEIQEAYSTCLLHNIYTHNAQATNRAQFLHTVRDDIQADESHPLLQRLLAGDRGALAKAITLVESRHPRKKSEALLLLSDVLKHIKKRDEENSGTPITFRAGFSGPPGAGKSTFLDMLGTHLTKQGHKVAVLAVDPSSSRTGGVGQSEFAVADMVDMFVLLIPPAGGDELQGVKRGIVEMADLLVVTKSDGNLLIPARRVQGDYMSALKIIKPKSKHWRAKVLRVSAREDVGVTDVWTAMEEYRAAMLDSGALLRTRREQRVGWMWTHVQHNMMSALRKHPKVKKHVAEVERRVLQSELDPGTAADLLVSDFFDDDR